MMLASTTEGIQWLASLAAPIPSTGVSFGPATLRLRGQLGVEGAGPSYEAIIAAAQAADADPAVERIVFDIDSHGGAVPGVWEAARAIRSLGKPTRARITGMAGSAAYWLAAACNEIVAVPTAVVGAVGAILTITRPKVEDLPFVLHRFVSSTTPNKDADPGTPEGAEQLQAVADSHASVFLDEIALFRGWDRASVESRCGGGRIFPAAAALAAGLIDRLEGEQMEDKTQAAKTEDVAAPAAAPPVEAKAEDMPMDPAAIAAEIAALEAKLAGLKAQLKVVEKQGAPADDSTTPPPPTPPSEDVQEMAAKIQRLEMSAAIEPLIASGRIAPGERADAELAYKAQALHPELATFDRFYASRKPSILLDRVSTGGTPPPAPVLSASAQLIARAEAYCLSNHIDPNGPLFAQAIMAVQNK